MSASIDVGAGGCGIDDVWTSNTGGSDIIYVLLCTMGGCLGGSPSCGGLMNGWDIL